MMRFFRSDLPAVFFREDRTPGGAVIFLMLLPFTSLGALELGLDGLSGRSSKRKSSTGMQPCTTVESCCSGVGFGLLIGREVLKGVFFMVSLARRCRSRFGLP